MSQCPGLPPNLNEFYSEAPRNGYMHRDYRNLGANLVGTGSPSVAFFKELKKQNISKPKNDEPSRRFPWPLTTLRQYVNFNKNIAVLVENAEAAGIKYKEFDSDYFLEITRRHKGDRG